MHFYGKAGPIKTSAKLANALDLPLGFLEQVASRSDDENYKRVKEAFKKDGSLREVFSPSRDLRLVQRSLSNRILKKPAVVSWPEYVFGGIHNSSLQAGQSSRDYVACAAVHCGARSLLKVDVKNFFENVHFEVVFDVFRHLLRWGSAPSNLAAKLCTRDGVLPQGGITSSYLALLCLHDVEPKVAATLKLKGLAYTRYVDDITVSSKHFNFDFSFALSLIEQMLRSKNLFVNQSKTSIQRSGTEGLRVHNLRIAFATPRLPSDELRRIKLVCKQTELMAKERGVKSYAYRRRFYRSVGLVNKLARVGNNQHRPMIERLRKVKPLPNQKDYDIATTVGLDLRWKYDERKFTYWYERRYNTLMERLNIISKENPSWAKTLRSYMKNHFRPMR